MLNQIAADTWEVIMRPGKKLRIGDRVAFAEDLQAEILEKKDDGVTKVKFYFEGLFETLLDEYGNMPLPPYITKRLEDQERYQTVYAKERGSAAAPTAGLHFTPELMEKIREKGIEIIPVLLHVGLGTFRPVKVDNVENHKMHSEYYSISGDSARRINETRARGGRIVAVGTTSVRTLESVAAEDGTVKSRAAIPRFLSIPATASNALMPLSQTSICQKVRCSCLSPLL